MRLTTSLLFWVTFAVGATAVLLQYVTGAAAAPLIVSYMAAPGILPPLYVYWRLTAELPSVLMTLLIAVGLNGLIYGGVAVAIWKAYQALKR